ncbi:MAG: TetR-like C-terminal domain-containing protein [Ancalomicrobiaceae bacterium]|nr:TetR-like C-terminal domain-containing protein [Ancalomicrobiaceae bacterium]
MERKAKRSHAEMTAEAVDTAYAIVGAEGITALTIRRLAEAIDCSVGTIYNLFLDFDDLELHLAVRVVGDMRARLFAEPLPDCPADRLRLIAARYIAFAFERPRLWSMLFSDRSSSGRPLPQWYETAVADLVATAVARASEAFPGDPTEGRERIEVLWASLHGIAALGLSGKLGFVTAASAPTLADKLVLTFLAGAERPRTTQP